MALGDMRMRGQTLAELRRAPLGAFWRSLPMGWGWEASRRVRSGIICPTSRILTVSSARMNSPSEIVFVRKYKRGFLQSLVIGVGLRGA